MESVKTSNIETVREIVGHITASHFFLLPPEVQFDYVNKLGAVFSGLARAIAREEYDPILFKLSQEIQSVFVQWPFNEYVFARKLKTFIVAARLEDDWVLLLTDLDQLIAHARPFYFSEEITKKESARLSFDKIIEHDKKILLGSGQLYALDYFLYMNKLLSNAKSSDAQDIILRGDSRIPSLRADALSEDMLTKIVYSLWSKKFRYRMMRDFYEYKKVFVNLGDAVGNSEVELVVRSLRMYCLNLLTSYSALGIDQIINGVYFPYSKGTEISVIINNLKTL